jgi:hypothetical protein
VAAQHKDWRKAIMNPPTFGNGKCNIIAEEMGGWIRVSARQSGTPIVDLGGKLSASLSGWLRENPDRRLVAVVPINENGNTIELHVWYEFQDVSRQMQKQ